jgi:hypothetical protein
MKTLQSCGIDPQNVLPVLAVRRLVIPDAKGRVRVEIAQQDNGTSAIQFFDANGKRTAIFNITEHGLCFEVEHPRGGAVASAYLTNEKSPRLTTYLDDEVVVEHEGYKAGDNEAPQSDLLALLESAVSMLKSQPHFSSAQSRDSKKAWT